jgi:hypothetical protein
MSSQPELVGGERLRLGASQRRDHCATVRSVDGLHGRRGRSELVTVPDTVESSTGMRLFRQCGRQMVQRGLCSRKNRIASRFSCHTNLTWLSEVSAVRGASRVARCYKWRTFLQANVLKTPVATGVMG